MVALQRAEQVQDHVENELHDADLRLVLPPTLDAVWSIVKPLLHQAEKHGDGMYDASDVYHLIKRHQMWLWVVGTPIRGIIVTEIVRFPQDKRLLIFAVAGVRPDDWRGILAKIEAYGRDTGCSSVYLWGREGWKRELPEYEHTHCVLRKRLR